MAGVYLGPEGFLSRKSLQIRRSDVLVFGADAILARHSNVVGESTKTTESAKWVRRDRLYGWRVATPGGTRVGTVGDVLVSDDIRVVGFSLSSVQVEGPVEEKQTIPRESVLATDFENSLFTIGLTKAEGQTLTLKGRSASLEICPCELRISSRDRLRNSNTRQLSKSVDLSQRHGMDTLNEWIAALLRFADRLDPEFWRRLSELRKLDDSRRRAGFLDLLDGNRLQLEDLLSLEVDPRNVAPIAIAQLPRGEARLEDLLWAGIAVARLPQTGDLSGVRIRYCPDSRFLVTAPRRVPSSIRELLAARLGDMWGGTTE